MTLLSFLIEFHIENSRTIMHLHMHLLMHLHMHLHMHLLMHLHMHLLMHLHMHLLMHLHMHLHSLVYHEQNISIPSRG